MQLAVIGHVITCIVRKGFSSIRQTVWPQIERLSALSRRIGQVLLRRLGATGAAVSRQPVCSREGDPPPLLLLLRATNFMALLDEASHPPGLSRWSDDTNLWKIQSADEHLLLLVDQFVYCWRLRAGLFLAALNLTPEGKTAGTLAHTNTYYDTHIDMY